MTAYTAGVFGSIRFLVTVLDLGVGFIVVTVANAMAILTGAAAVIGGSPACRNQRAVGARARLQIRRRGVAV